MCSANPVVADKLGVRPWFERLRQLRPGRHTELWKEAIQVGADGSVREVEALADLPIREAVRRKLRDLELLRRQLGPRFWYAAANTLARRTQLAARAAGKTHVAES